MDFLDVVAELDAVAGERVAVSLYPAGETATAFSAGAVELTGRLTPEPRHPAGLQELERVRPELAAASFRVGEAASFRVERSRFRAAEWRELEGRCLVVGMDGWTLVIWAEAAGAGADTR